MAKRTGAYLLVAAAVFGVYFGGAKLGLGLAVAHGVITPVWPPTGIAIAALLLFGLRLWPAVALAALASNATSDASLAVSAAIAVGNTVEAVLAAYLLRRASFRLTFERVRDVLAFAVLAALASTVVAATNGLTVLAIAGEDASSPFGSRWFLWWLGDATGALLVAPLILVWATRAPYRLPARRLLEGGLLLAALAGVSAVIFLGGYWRYPYVLFPLLLWASVRFTQLGAVTASFVVSAFAVAGIVSESTPLAGHDDTVAAEILQGLLAVVAISLLVLGASLSERDAAAASLRQAAVGLAEAQSLAHIGSWEWDIAGDRVTWSSELYRIYDIEPLGDELAYETYLARIHPSDRDGVRRVIDEALTERRPFEMTHRIVLADGRERFVQGRGRVVLDRSGHPIRMVGTTQDVTERRRVEEVRENILAAVSHELRTPLTSILGFAFTLRERWTTLPDERRERMIGIVAEQAARLERLLTDLLDVDRLRHGRLRAETERSDLGALVAGIVAARADGRPIDIQTGSVFADVDRAKVERIVDNLLSNAERHTPAGSPISVVIERDGTGVLLRVDDRGPGVPEEEKETIFEAFSRGSASGASVGVGVGLSLVAQFAALHGGRAWVEDNPGGGASFRVLLPGSASGA
ncbi:MAG TPA: MASE1 domain-containing protein [Gaiellaceae bacterium]|nr:MASE1 domain-containing protein [Gaiellaceae bacterium]